MLLCSFPFYPHGRLHLWGAWTRPLNRFESPGLTPASQVICCSGSQEEPESTAVIPNSDTSNKRICSPGEAGCISVTAMLRMGLSCSAHCHLCRDYTSSILQSKWLVVRILSCVTSATSLEKENWLWMCCVATLGKIAYLPKEAEALKLHAQVWGKDSVDHPHLHGTAGPCGLASCLHT